jgi:hypothetical protein
MPQDVGAVSEAIYIQYQLVIDFFMAVFLGNGPVRYPAATALQSLQWCIDQGFH